MIVNLAEQPSGGVISLEGDVLETQKYVLINDMTGRKTAQNGREMALPGLEISLEGYEARIVDLVLD